MLIFVEIIYFKYLKYVLFYRVFQITCRDRPGYNRASKNKIMNMYIAIAIKIGTYVQGLKLVIL